MPTAQEIPITGTVLSWAIDESGWERDVLAGKLGVTTATLRSWENEAARPNKTQFDALVRYLKRPSATFFLPAPPPTDEYAVDFRRLSGASIALGPEERRQLRDTARIQRELSWILQDLGHAEVELYPASVEDDPEDVAEAERERLGVSVTTQLGWQRPSDAFEAWRSALAGAGVFAFALQLGRGKIRGFALKDEYAPVVGVNTTGFNEVSRIYTLFHEYAHLLLSQSDVLGDLDSPASWDQAADIERWCERFAASLLLPRDRLHEYLIDTFGWAPGDEIGTEKLRRLSNRFKVSMRAMALRLWEIGVAPRSLFTSLGPASERRPGGGGGDRRPAIVRRRYGESFIQILHEALDEDAVDLHELLDLLGITLDDWAELETMIGAR